jgi:hydroxymethylpyrimidine/phosphomethylpyrimidine kinase
VGPERRRSARPVVLALSGLDPCAGAGLTADVRTIAACGARPVGVPTCLTVQSRHGFGEAWPVPSSQLLAMVDAAHGDAAIAAIKIGLCVDADTIRALAGWLAGLEDARPRVVVDPVLSATAGGGPAAVEVIARSLAEELAPHVDVFTPNLPELALLGGLPDLRSRLHAGGAVFVTGGHGEGAEIVDRLYTDHGERDFVHARLDLGPVHGTGCALSSALAAGLACELGLEDACERAVRTVRGFLQRTRSSPDGLPVPLAID